MFDLSPLDKYCIISQSFPFPSVIACAKGRERKKYYREKKSIAIKMTGKNEKMMRVQKIGKPGESTAGFMTTNSF